MDWLNYHHLLYFWTVAREGSIAAACEKLHLAQPTISGQLRQLEKAVGEKLYERRGRQLVLTDTGKLVQQYADEIFTVGKELQDVLKGRTPGRPLKLRVGVPDFLPKLIAFRLLEPAYHLPEGVHVHCAEGKLPELLGELALHELDVVFSDTPSGSLTSVRAFNHHLGECGVAFFGTRALEQQLAGGFPESLDGIPVLLPSSGTALRRSIEHWFDQVGVEPEIVGEFDDMALLKVFAQQGIGIVPAPVAIDEEIRRQYDLTVIGHVEGVQERFYAITVERRINHPAVVSISENARQSIFRAE